MDESRDSVLYLVDASTSMVQCGALDAALSSACEAIRETARQGVARFDAGVIIYNIDAPGGTKCLLNLGEPSIDDLKSLIRMTSTGVRGSIASSDASYDSLVSAIRMAKSAMNQLHTKSFRRVVLITNDDDPCRGNANAASVAANLMSDLVATPAVIVPIFINDTEFDVSKFWLQIDYSPPNFGDGDQRRYLEPVESEQLNARHESLVLSRSRRKVSSFRGVIALQSLKCGVYGYTIFRSRPSQPSAFNVGFSSANGEGYETREILKPVSTVVKAQSGTEIDTDGTSLTRKFKLSSSANDGEWSVGVDPADLDRLVHFHAFDTPTIEIQHFIPVSRALAAHSRYGYVGHSMFVAANDEKWQNSSLAFASLHRNMTKNKVAAVALCHPVSRGRRSAPERVILYSFNPCPRIFEEQRDLHPRTTAGLYLVPLPFTDDIRNIAPKKEAETLSPLLQSCTTSLIRKFKLPVGFDPTRFGNPLYAQFTYILEHLALSLPLEVNDNNIFTEPRDSTRPRYAKIKQFSEKIRPLLEQALGPFPNGEKPEPQHKPPPAKVIKTDLTINDAREAIQAGSLSKWTVANLKSVARQASGETLPTRKADLIKFLQNYL